MEKLNIHHALWTRRQIQSLGGKALWLRNLGQMQILMDADVHNELHADIEPASLLPQENARRAFSGVQELGLEYMGKLEAINVLARHMGVVSLRSSSSLQTQRIAMHLEENLVKQLPYIRGGIVND